MSYDPLLSVLGLAALASATVPTTFGATAYRGGVAIAPSALPSNPTVGTLIVDSGDGNALKHWDGAAWQTGGSAAGSDGYVQFSASGVLASSSGLIFDDANDRLSTVGLVITPAALPGSPIAGQVSIDSGASNALKWYDGSAWQVAGGGSGGTPAGSDTEIQYNDSGSFGASPGFTFSGTLLTINTTGVASIAAPAGTSIQNVAGNGNAAVTRIVQDVFMGTGGGYATFLGRAARGTISAPTALQSGDEIVRLGARGYGATGFSSANRAYISQYAAENWTDAAQGTRMGFFTTTPGTLATVEHLRVWGNGCVSVGTNLSSAPLTAALMVTGTGTYTNLANLRFQAFDTLNSYIQANIQNLSNGTDASSDWVCTNDTGTDTTNFVDMGINSSGWSSASWTVNGANDAYVYTSSGNFAVGTASAGKNVVIFSGGTLAANIRASFTDSGITLTPALSNAGANTGLTFTGAANTAVTASTEDSDVAFNLARTVQWATGALATQRAVTITAPTYAFVGASTISDAATVAIIGQPVAGTNATITRNSALWVQSGVVRVQNAATQDGILLSGRAGGTSNYYATIIPGTLTASITLTTPVTTGTIALGTGTASRVAFWSGTNVVSSSASWTATTTSGALLVALASGTSTATAATRALNTTVTFSGLLGNGTTSAVGGTATYSGAVNAAGAVLSSGTFITTASGAFASTLAVCGSYNEVAVAPTAAALSSYYGSYSSVANSAANNAFSANSSLIGSLSSAVLYSSYTGGGQIAAVVGGSRIVYGVGTSNGTGTNSVFSAYGVYIVGPSFTGSGGAVVIGSHYGVYIGAPTLSNATITSNYGIYQADATAVNYFAGVLLSLPKALPGSPTTGMIVVDSGDSNALKWWNGTAWQSSGAAAAGGSDTQIQYNNAGALGGLAGFYYTAPGNATFDYTLTRTYVNTPTLALGEYGTVNALLDVDPTTTASGSTGAAGRFYTRPLDVTGLANTMGQLAAISAKYSDDDLVGGSWNGNGFGILVSVIKRKGGNGPYGVSCNVYTSGNGVGGAFGVNKDTTGDSSVLIGLQGTVSSSSTGTVTDARGLNVSVSASAGTITTAYGVYIGTVSSLNISNSYGIYQEDPEAANVFMGRVSTPASDMYAGFRITPGITPSVTIQNGDMWSVSATGLFHQLNGVTSQVALNVGVPSAEASNRTLSNADNAKNLICSGTRVFTVNTGLVAGFGCSFKGTVSFTGTATITDVRTTGATNPWCALCATGTDTYDIVGSKA